MCAVYTVGVRTLHEQLRDALERSGWSVAELLRKTGLDIAHQSLARKLRGELPMKTREAEVIATALGCTLAFVPQPASAAS